MRLLAFRNLPAPRAVRLFRMILESVGQLPNLVLDLTRTRRLSPTRRWKLQNLVHEFANSEEMAVTSFTFLPVDGLVRNKPQGRFHLGRL